MWSEPNFVNYADAMQESAHELSIENARLREALQWYADSINCRRGVFGDQMRNGNRNAWMPDDGNRARAALADPMPITR
jgi:hypothetical protein